MVTPQQRADELLRHWQLLWPLPAAQRIARIDEISADLVFEDMLNAVAGAMVEPEPEPYRFDMEKIASISGAIGLCLCFWLPIGVIAWEFLRP